MQKTFFWKDETGRGFTNNFTLEDILNCQDEENYDGDSLHEWAKNAEEGDTWKNKANSFTCTNS